MKNIFISLISLFILTLPAAASLNTALKEWKAFHNCTVKLQNNSLEITGIGKDSGIVMIPETPLDPRKYNFIEITYQAENISQRTSGQFYYWNDMKKFTADRKWNIPSLKGDGKWHTMRILLPVHGGNIKDYLTGGKLCRLRLDLMDQPGGKIRISGIRFGFDPELPKHLPRQEKLTRWQEVEPQFLYPAACGNYFAGKMIFSPDDLPGKLPAKFALRKKFTLKPAIQAAYIQFAADDEADVYINGRLAASQKGDASWRKSTLQEITGLLHPGENIWAVSYFNGGSAGGFAGEIFVRYMDGSFTKIDSDTAFITGKTDSANWMMPDFDDSAWVKVKSRPAPPAAPWGVQLDYTDFANPQKMEKIIFPDKTYTAGEVVKFTAVFQGNMPPGIPLTVAVKDQNGKTLFSNKLKADRKTHLKPLDNGRWQLSFQYRLPEFLPAGRMSLELSGGLYLPESSISGKFTCRPKLHQKKQLVSEVRPSAAGPELFINGKKVYPLIGCMATSCEPDAMPMNLRLLTPDSYMDAAHWWHSKTTYRFDVFDMAAAKLFQTYPDALVIVQIPVYEPEWFRTEYPGELARNSKGELPAQFYGKVSFGSKLFINMMKKALADCITYLENSPYADRIAGYRIVGGSTTEWLGWGYHHKRELFDYSKPGQEYFRQYCRRNSLPFTGIPDADARMAADGDALLLDPEKHRAVIAYRQAHSEMVADMIIEFCRTAKQASNNRKIVGCYYGYSFYLGGSRGFQTSGHFALKRLLDAKTVDFISSPPSYSLRNIGDFMGDMKPFATLSAHNCLAIVEDDTRTHNIPPMGRFQTMTPWHTVQILRRNLGIALCRNMPGMLFFLEMDFHTKFNFPEMIPLIEVIRSAGQFAREKSIPRRAEIALVVSEKAFALSPWDKTFVPTGRTTQFYGDDGKVKISREWLFRLTGSLINGQLNDLGRCGAPVDYILAEDLADHPGDYKLYIFANCFHADPNLIKAVKTLQKKPVTLLFLYAPGVVDNGKFSTAGMKKLTGLDFEAAPEALVPAVILPDKECIGNFQDSVFPAFGVKAGSGTLVRRYVLHKMNGYAEKKIGQSTTIFCGAWLFDPAFYRKLARRAGVHIFSDSNDPCEANDSFFLLHARTPGRKTIRLPRKTDVADLFTGKIIARQCDKFTVEVKLHETKLFYYGDDAEMLTNITGKDDK